MSQLVRHSGHKLWKNKYSTFVTSWRSFLKIVKAGFLVYRSSCVSGTIIIISRFSLTTSDHCFFFLNRPTTYGCWTSLRMVIWHLCTQQRKWSQPTENFRWEGPSTQLWELPITILTSSLSMWNAAHSQSQFTPKPDFSPLDFSFQPKSSPSGMFKTFDNSVTLAEFRFCSSMCICAHASD